MDFNLMTEHDRIQLFTHTMASCIPDLIDDDTVDRLQNMNFFTAPASINHHGKYEGGLFDHSFTVMTTLLDLTERLDLNWERKQSPYIVGMFHDLCKIDDYIRSFDSWAYNNMSLFSGHGAKSVILLQQLIKTPLTYEEMLCINWHTGAFDDKDKWSKYSRAVKEYNNVLFTHTADMIASNILGV